MVGVQPQNPKRGMDLGVLRDLSDTVLSLTPSPQYPTHKQAVSYFLEPLHFLC